MKADIELVRKTFGDRIPVFVYTGYEWKEAANHPVVRMADYVKVGSYRQDLPPGEFASSNQRMEKLS